MDKLLDGKVVIVTGAGRGIGRAAAYALADAGASLALADLDEDGARETAEHAQHLGVKTIVVKTNVAQEQDVAALVERTVGEFGRLDGAFNNAGVEQRNTPLHELSEAQWNTVIDINLKGVFFCLKHEIAAMLKTGGGAIVNVSSLAALRSNSQISYEATKAALLGLGRSAAVSHARDNIRVNTILPGLIDSSMVRRLVGDRESAVAPRIPMRRQGTPWEIAKAIVFLLSDDASYITGTELIVDGGLAAR